MFKRAMCLAGVVIAATLNGSHVHAGDSLSNQEILRLAPGTFQAVVRGKYAVTVTLARDGTVVGRLKGLEDRGRWTVRGDQLCIVLPTWTRGRVECSSVVADNGWYRGRNVSFRKL